MSEPDGGVGALVVRFYDQLWNAWDDSAVEAVLAEQFRFRGSLGQRTEGLAQWRRYRDGIRAVAPDFHNEILDLVTDGDRAAARLIFSGTHAGDLLGYPPTGQQFRYAGAAFFLARDGHLVEAWVLGDLADLTGQLREQ